MKIVSSVFAFSSFLALSALIIAPSLRGVFKYSGDYAATVSLLYAGISLMVYAALISRRSNGMISDRLIIIGILFVATAMVWFVYPIADGLKSQMGGSDQDDCVIIGASHLMNLTHPYIEKSYYGNMCSPGPGMLALYIPFVALGIYQLGGIVVAALSIYVFKKYVDDSYQASVFTIILFGSLFVIELLAAGSDLVLLGCGLLILTMGVVRAIENRNMVSLLALAILAGLLASTRVNFIIVAPLMSAFIFFHWRKGAVWFFVLSISVAVLPSAFLYYLNPADFTPFHLVAKSRRMMASPVKEIGVFLSATAGLLSLYVVNRSVTFIPLATFLSLAPSLMAVSLGNFLRRDNDLAKWEGASYLMPLIPLAVALLVLCFAKKSDWARRVDAHNEV